MSTATPALFGVGADYRYNALYDFEGGLDGFFADYKDRLSHLQIISFGDDDEIAKVRGLIGDLPVVHHMTSVAPVTPEGPSWKHFEDQDRQSKLVGAAWQYEDLGYWYLGPYRAPYFAPPLFEAEVADATADVIRQLNQRASVPFLPENPTCTFVAGSLTLGQFFTRIALRADCPVVLDVSHLISYARCTGRRPRDVLADFPVSAVWELHIAGGRIDPDHSFRYLDSHCEPILDEVLDFLPEVVAACGEARAITFEIVHRLPRQVFEQDCVRLERVLRGTGFTPRLHDCP